MTPNRRQILRFAAIGGLVYAAPASAAPSRGVDATQFGVRPGAPDDQSQALQRAIDQAARNRTPLYLPAGVYRAGGLTLPRGATVTGARGKTRIVLTRGPSLFASSGADDIALADLVMDGGALSLPERRGLVHLNGATGLRIANCRLERIGGHGLLLTACAGDITGNDITGSTDTAIFSIDSRGGMRIVGNTIAKSGNGGIRVWQAQKRGDGSLVADNRIDDTGSRSGGDGENGNGVNVFRAADVTVRNNVISNAAFSAVRGNAASNFLVVGNKCTGFGETAMYAEFDYVGATFVDNVIDGAENGISVTNFDHGGRLGIVRNNTVRNLGPRRPGSSIEGSGVGIAAEADVTVDGNTVENAAKIGILAGWGPYLRDVVVSRNTIRQSPIGVAVSVANGAGKATIASNRIAGARRGAIVGMEWHDVVTPDLARSGPGRYRQLTITGNEVS